MQNIVVLKRSAHLPITLGARIFIGFGLVIALFVMQDVITEIGFDDAINGVEEFARINSNTSSIVEIELNLLKLQSSVLGYTQSGYEGVIIRVHRLIGILKHQLQTIKTAITDEQRLDILRRMTGHFENYSVHFDMAIEDRQYRDQLVDRQLHELVEKTSATLTLLISQSMERNNPSIASSAGIAQVKLLLAHQSALNFTNKPRSLHVRNAQQYISDLRGALQRLSTELQHANLMGDRQQVMQIIETTSRYEQDFMAMVQTTRGYMNLVYVVMAGEAWEFAFLANKLKKLTTNHRDNHQQNMIATISDTQQVGLWVSSCATLLGLLLAWLITRNIAGSVKAMTITLTNLARGKMDEKIPGRGRKDEIGAMAKAAQVFKEKAHELENASRYKSEFLANMSHELRTPLNSILILSKMFALNEHKNLNNDQVESATVIHESGINLLQLINDILDLSKIEAGRMDVLPSAMQLVSFVASIERLFKPVASNKGLKFGVEIDQNLPDSLTSDWVKVEQIIRNFLSNAFKFTAQGSVSVHIHKPKGTMTFLNLALNTSNTIVITVKDTGIGILPNQREQIFEAFRQADGSTSRKYGGTGLGLSISRNFAELLGGEIQVESVQDQGAAFSLYLPLLFPANAEVNQQSALTATERLTVAADEVASVDFCDISRTVLIVDDDSNNIFALQQILKSCVGKILVAANGQEALALLEKHGEDIHMVLMDIMMPIMNGFATMRIIRKQTRFSQLPILALTAQVMSGDREKCLAAGASDYIAKPVDANKLLAMLAYWLGKPQIPAFSGAQIKRQAVDTALDVGLLLEEKTQENDRIFCQPGEPPIKVLIVDADMRNTFSIAQLLQKNVSEVIMAQDGAKAMSQLEKHPDVSIILMAIIMPNTDGFETTKKIRDNPQFSNLPIVALTNEPTPENWNRCLEAGINDYITKPVEFASLLSKMRVWLQMRNKDEPALPPQFGSI